jgi:hypothetical protein
MQRIDETGRRDDRGAVLVVVEHRNVEQLAQALLDDEASGALMSSRLMPPQPCRGS